MSKSWILVFLVVAFALAGCISAERKAEYAAWQASDDGVRTVMLEEFESKYQQGWRERAAEKKKARLAREEAERVLAARNAEYDRWLASDDKENGVSLEVFEQKYKEGWEDRAAKKKQIRLAREAKNRLAAKRKAEFAELQRKRDEVSSAMATNDLAWIRKIYGKGRGCPNPFRTRQSGDWIKSFTGPRLELSEADKLAGEALLSEFGNKFMPNAYANYEKVKDAAVELQQVFNEEFSEPWTIKNTSSKWNSFNKVLEKFVKARTEYFLCHDELCHYWVSYRLGVLTADDFAQIDAQKVAVKLLPQNVSQVGYTMVDCRKLDEKDADFAEKYAPETYALYQRLEHEWKQSRALVDEVGKQRVLIDAARFDRAYYNANLKCNDIAREMNMLAADFQAWHFDHRMTEKSSEVIAECDLERAKGLKSFFDSLPTYVKDRTLGRVISESEMVNLHGFNLQRTEVTQMQWMIVMGNNPSHHVKPDCPVEKVSWTDCQAFIEKLSEMDGVVYRLPDEDEWVRACVAGGSGDWGERRNRVEGSLDAMGWYSGNSNRGTHAVALKEPNAWGLFDMYGNVYEWTSTTYGYSRVCRGGSWNSNSGCCSVGDRIRNGLIHRDDGLGFRLAASQD